MRNPDPLFLTYLCAYLDTHYLAHQPPKCARIYLLITTSSHSYFNLTPPVPSLAASTRYLHTMRSIFS